MGIHNNGSQTQRLSEALAAEVEHRVDVITEGEWFADVVAERVGDVLDRQPSTWLVVYVTMDGAPASEATTLTPDWVMHETAKEAWDAYQRLVKRDDTYTASVARVLGSTDYDC